MSDHNDDRDVSDDPAINDPDHAGAEDAEVEGFLVRSATAEEILEDAPADLIAKVTDGEAEQPGELTSREARDLRIMAERFEGAVPVTAEQKRRQSRRGFLGFAGAAALGAAAFGWVQRPSDSGGTIPDFLRSGFEFNDAVWSNLIDPGQMAREYAISDADPIRINGTLGLDDSFRPATYRLRIERADGSLIDTFDVDDISYESVLGTATTDRVFEHKCIEGWANITHWRGATFADVMLERYADEIGDNRFVSLETPDGGYYVGLDMDTALHPQTLLASGLEGEALEDEHGAPLRLVTPIHYGIKSLKRIGVIRFLDERPADYWAERGYDWHSTH